MKYTEEEWSKLNNESKGSDEVKPRVFGTKDDKIFWSDKPIQEGHPKVELPKEEISDEEIEKFADEELGTIRTDFDFGVIQGMKWYREQLKNK